MDFPTTKIGPEDVSGVLIFIILTTNYRFFFFSNLPYTRPASGQTVVTSVVPALPPVRVPSFL